MRFNPALEGGAQHAHVVLVVKAFAGRVLAAVDLDQGVIGAHRMMISNLLNDSRGLAFLAANTDSADRSLWQIVRGQGV